MICKQSCFLLIVHLNFFSTVAPSKLLCRVYGVSGYLVQD